MIFSVIDAEKRHVKAISELEKLCFSMPWTEEQIMSQLPDKEHEFIVAESNRGELLGYVGMMYVLDEGYISNVAVNPDFRRQHIGTEIIKELLRRSYELGLAFVSLEVRESNSPAQRLYSSFEFKIAGKRKNYYDFPKEDAIIMTKLMK